MNEIIKELVDMEDISYIGEVSNSTARSLVKESMENLLNTFVKELLSNPQDFLNELSKKTNRLEVINHNSGKPVGRVYTNYHCKSVELSFQDKNKTLKIFI